MQRTEIKLKASCISRCLDPETHSQLWIHFAYQPVYSCYSFHVLVCWAWSAPDRASDWVQGFLGVCSVFCVFRCPNFTKNLFPWFFSPRLFLCLLALAETNILVQRTSGCFTRCMSNALPIVSLKSWQISILGETKISAWCQFIKCLDQVTADISCRIGSGLQSLQVGSHTKNVDFLKVSTG